MRDTVFYEWGVETVAIYSDGSTDIIDIDFAGTLAGAVRMMTQPLPTVPDATVEYRLCLVRCTGNEDEWETGRSYAYVDSGRLPLQFDDCGTTIPQRFHTELAQVREALACA